MPKAAGPPRPLIEIAVIPQSAEDGRKLDHTLSQLNREDPTVCFSSDRESGLVTLSGSDEARLSAIVDRLTREFNVVAKIRPPQVAYRETITRTVEITHTYQSASVTLRLSPLPPEDGFIFKNAAPQKAVPPEFIPGIARGLQAAIASGPLAGFPVIDLQASLIDGTHYELDASPHAFEVAAREAGREGLRQASPTLLEPIMRIEVVTPDDCMGDVIGDLNNRHGLVVGMDSRDNARVVEAMVPLALMLSYSDTLHGMSQGRAQHKMQFDHYDRVPQSNPPPDDFPPAIGLRA